MLPDCIVEDDGISEEDSDHSIPRSYGEPEIAEESSFHDWNSVVIHPDAITGANSEQNLAPKMDDEQEDYDHSISRKDDDSESAEDIFCHDWNSIVIHPESISEANSEQSLVPTMNDEQELIRENKVNLSEMSNTNIMI